MEQCRIENLYDLNETIAKDIFDHASYPWEVLPDIHDFILKLGSTLDMSEYGHRKYGDDVWIHKSAVVFDSVYIHGPAIICKDAEVRQCAFIRGNAIVGEKATVGNSTELKNVILFNHVEVPHYNYDGDSILGCYAHMGAGAITSNIKADRKNIVIRDGDHEYVTGLRKIGAMLGDHAEIGCNTVLNPGTVVGRYTNIYPVCSVRGVVPEHSIYKSKDSIVRKSEG